MKWGAAVFILVSLLAACSEKSDQGDPTEEAPPRLILGDANLSDVPILEWDQPDAGEPDAGCCGVPCHCGEEYEHQVRCWRTQLFFCTPNGQPPGDDPSLYQQAVILDVCDENGEPCEPTGVNDVDCQWEVVDMGDCEDWLECDPTSEDILVNEDVPCTDTDDNGEVYTGLQDFICQKGKVIAGPCEPCETEVCDGVDNDCDNIVDEGDYPCESECGDGTASCVNGELIACNAPTPLPEVCNNLDDDCDDEVDEELIQPCETVCEDGVEFCVEGEWTGCTAQPPLPEECNGQDDNCNGLNDEGLDCACPPEMIGFLMPCMEDPLLCGQGFKTCECANEDCSSTQMTQCLALCTWLPPNGEDCDPLGGLPTDEVCNNFDDDCDQDIDEDLFSECYTGPDGTVNVGICLPGQMVCQAGDWGNEFNGLFVEDMCLGEVTPLEEDLCTGTDDNCDGEIENVMEETDILFIVDTSGSMSGTINAVQQAMSMFSAHYSDQEVIQWGLVIGPLDGNPEVLSMATNLVPFQQFLPVLANVDDESSSNEMLYDALYLSIRNLIPPQIQPQFVWDNIVSNPSIDNWTVNWREDAHHVVIVFSDEDGQSYTNPEINQQMIQDVAALADDLSIYTFSDVGNQDGAWGWEPVSIGGEWSTLTSNPNSMFDKLMEIIEETACGGEDEPEMGASFILSPLNPLSYPISRTNRFYPASYWGFWATNIAPNLLDQGLTDSNTDEMWLYLPTKQCIHPSDVLIE